MIFPTVEITAYECHTVKKSVVGFFLMIKQL